MHSQITKDAFVKFFPQYISVAEKLQEESISYAIFAGSEVWLLTNSRVPTDLDILVRSEDLETVAKLFNQEIKIKQKEGMSAEYILIDNVEIVSNVKITKEDIVMDISLNESMIERLIELDLGNNIVLPLLPVEDTIIIKALLRRGESEGKFDVQDIESLKKAVEIDAEYLKDRINNLRANNYVNGLI